MVYHLNQSGVVQRHFFTLKIDSEVLGTKKEKSPYGALTLVWEKSPNGAFNCTKRTFLQNRNEAPFGLFSFFSNLHHQDFSPKPNGKSFGQNVLLVLTFIFCEPHRGSRGLPLAFSDCLMYFFQFRFSGVATSKPSLGLFSGPKKK